jgi:hypothetical protein
MAHSPESVEEFVCESCQVIYTGTPVHLSAAEHSFDPPESCGACGATEFVSKADWVRHHE